LLQLTKVVGCIRVQDVVRQFPRDSYVDNASLRLNSHDPTALEHLGGHRHHAIASVSERTQYTLNLFAQMLRSGVHSFVPVTTGQHTPCILFLSDTELSRHILLLGAQIGQLRARSSLSS